MKISVSLSDAGCRKPNCAHRFSITSRHHMKSEKQWVNLWNYPNAMPLWKGDPDRGRRLHRALVERYHQFREKDVVRLCEWHHVEIHMGYKLIIARLEVRFRKRSAFFSVDEALIAMRQCRLACLEWLKIETPGIDPKTARRRGYWKG